jgi:hypothetical protein
MRSTRSADSSSSHLGDGVDLASAGLAGIGDPWCRSPGGHSRSKSTGHWEPAAAQVLLAIGTMRAVRMHAARLQRIRPLYLPPIDVVVDEFIVPRKLIIAAALFERL